MLWNSLYDFELIGNHRNVERHWCLLISALSQGVMFPNGFHPVRYLSVLDTYRANVFLNKLTDGRIHQSTCVLYSVCALVLWPRRSIIPGKKTYDDIPINLKWQYTIWNLMKPQNLLSRSPELFITLERQQNYIMTTLTTFLTFNNHPKVNWALVKHPLWGNAFRCCLHKMVLCFPLLPAQHFPP